MKLCAWPSKAVRHMAQPWAAAGEEKKRRNKEEKLKCFIALILSPKFQKSQTVWEENEQ